MIQAAATAPIASIDDALEALGSSPALLSADERAQLDRDGYVVFRDLIDPAWLEQLRAAVEAIAAAEGAAAGHDYQQEAGALRIGNLVNKGEAFDRVWTHPRYLAAIHHIIGGEFMLNAFSSREPLAGWEGRQQGLHLDGTKEGSANDFVDSTWMLDDFTAENGATRLVPGSHRWPDAPWDVMDAQDDHPQQIIVSAPAGSVLVFNGRVWHSGRLNRAGTRRRGLFPYMSSRARGDGGAYQRKHLLKSTWDRLAPAAHYLLGV